MDARKNCYREPEDFTDVFHRFPIFKLVLDVNHAYTNDPTTELTARFWDTYDRRIAQIHLSGYTELHEPLYKTRQQEILLSIKNLDVPMIIESILSPENLTQEQEFILAHLKSASR